MIKSGRSHITARTVSQALSVQNDIRVRNALSENRQLGSVGWQLVDMLATFAASSLGCLSVIVFSVDGVLATDIGTKRITPASCTKRAPLIASTSPNCGSFAALTVNPTA
jgi:hypothetical protein